MAERGGELKQLLALPLLFTAGGATGRVPIQSYEVVHTYPHDHQAFTEGLLYRDGRLYESSGLKGRSTIREVRLEDGAVLRSVALPPNLFGEGIADWGNELISLTWRSGIGFRWDRATFRRLGSFRYSGEGWALARNSREIVMSDGTPVLRFLDPRTMKVKRRLRVTEDGVPVANLNELEWVKGEILANVWLTDTIVRIDSRTGRVIGRINLAGLGPAKQSEDDVLNGIAYDAVRDRLFVTGKNWPKLYEIRILPRRH